MFIPQLLSPEPTLSLLDQLGELLGPVEPAHGEGEEGSVSGIRTFWR
jgi:hypothetical protein